MLLINFIAFCLLVAEIFMFESVNRRTNTRDGWTPAWPLSYKLTSAFCSGELKIQFSLFPIENPKLPNHQKKKKKKVKVNKGSSFEQTMLGWSPQMLIRSFLEISPPVLEIFEGFLPYMGVEAILVMLPQMQINFHSPNQKRLHSIFGFDQPSSFREGLKLWMTWKLWMTYH